MQIGQGVKTCFYIVAHADDWQLFMCPNVCHDLMNPDCRIVFIITTAGDAGAGERFWRAREDGTKSSVRFCLSPFTKQSETEGTRNVNHHPVCFWSLGNVTCYFLRLPDGNLDGEGFPAQVNQSLQKLERAEIEHLPTVDRTSIYTGWGDLCATLQALIQLEAPVLSDAWLNYLNPDSRVNASDHPDHSATGRAIQAMTIAPNVHQCLFIGYPVRNVAGQLAPKDLFWKAGMFAAYEKAVFDQTGYSTLQEGVGTYLDWCLHKAAFTILHPEN